MQKRWSKAEIAHLKRHASDVSLGELAQKLHTDVDTVRRKLKELGLSPQGEPQASAVDQALEHYAEALRLMHDQQWAKAEALLEQVAAEADSRQLADRARQGLVTCRRQIAAEAAAMEDPYLQAVYEKNQGNLEAALELCQAQDNRQDDERYAYLLASLHSLEGATEKALEYLETAIRLEPKNRVHAYHDPDFTEIRGREEFTKLVAGADS